MVEFIGTCTTCDKSIYCENGFLNGVYEEDKLYCFSCLEEEQE